MRILIIGTAHPDLERARAIATQHGSHVSRVATVPEALAHILDGKGADLLLVDVDEDIRDLTSQLRRARVSASVVAYGIDASPTAAVNAIRSGACEFLPLPPDAELIAAVLDAISEDRIDMIADDFSMRDTMELARKYARADATILVSGESGTGKEVLARFLHRQSSRGDRPMVAVNCAAIPDHLLESELFGHEKGAFTGAQSRRIGKFEEAHGSTLLLDEISEMDLRLQAKLLRAIQEREIDRLGGTTPVKVDIRLIATTNRNLEEDVRAGRFRQDLFFRLNVLALELPPLRARRTDIPSLAEFFARKHGVLGTSTPPAFDQQALDKLIGHDWPGNIRELENCIQRAVVIAEGRTISSDDIVLPTAPGQAADAHTPGSSLIGRSMAEVERDLILGTLDHTAGNRTHAARILGISIRTLRNKLNDYAREHGLAPSATASQG